MESITQGRSKKVCRLQKHLISELFQNIHDNFVWVKPQAKPLPYHKIKNFLKQDDSDGRERKFQFLEKLSKPVFNKKMYASIIDYVSETIWST